MPRYGENTGGRIFFGDPDAAKNSLPGNPPSRVTIGTFLIDKCETTWRQYIAYHRYVLKKKSYGVDILPEALDTPVITRDYEVVAAYCKHMDKPPSH